MKNLYFEDKKIQIKKQNISFLKDWNSTDAIDEKPNNLGAPNYNKINSISLEKLSKKLFLKHNFPKSKMTKKNFKSALKIRNIIFIQLVKSLNSFHKVNYAKRYWEIVIEPWFSHFIFFMHERWNIINNSNFLKKYTFYTDNIIEKELIPESYNNFNPMDKVFNEWVIFKIFEYQKKIKIKNKKESISNKYVFYNKAINFKKKIALHLFTLCSKFFKTNYFIKPLGISYLKFIILNLKLGQFPFIWIEPPYKIYPIDLKKRKAIFCENNKKKNLNNFLKEMLSLSIPSSYLENYYSIKKSLNNSYWPKSVKSIISSYDYVRNDFFKIWSAERCLNKNTKYIILQHGGNSPLAELSLADFLHPLIADKYLTWGWKKNIKNIIPFHAFSLSNRKVKFRKNINNNIYFCINTFGKFPYRYESSPRTNEEKLRKLNSTKEIINGLYENLTNNTIMRYLEKVTTRNRVKFVKSGIFRNISYDKGQAPFLKILPRAKIVIHDSNNTGFLESLFFNVPTILILDKKIETFEKSARKYVKLLEKKKIIHYDPKTVVNFINKNFNEIDKWWNQRGLQKVRRDFCNVYAKKSNSSLGDLAKVLKNTIL